jgi:hypothetical protein
MKKIIILFLVFILSSCTKSKNDEIATVYPITGKWYYKETVINGTNFPYTDHEICGKDYIEFYGSNSIKSIDIFNCVDDLDWLGTYSRNGNTLIINNGTESVNTEILELTANSLIYKYNYDNDGDGVTEVTISKFDR